QVRIGALVIPDVWPAFVLIGAVLAESAHTPRRHSSRVDVVLVATVHQDVPMQSHPNVTAVQDALESSGAHGEVRLLPDAVHTAAAAAEALGVTVGQIANSLVFDADGDPLLVLTSGAHRVDTAKVADLVGVGSVRRATPEFV